MKNRIWELDAARGACILVMVAFHLIYDLSSLFSLLAPVHNPVLQFVGDWGGSVFFLISGICVTLSRHPVRRGLTVLLSGGLVTAVTYGLYRLQFLDRSMVIWFGVLHCLGVCMLLWPLVRRFSPWALLLTGAVILAVGIPLEGTRMDIGPWLIPLGILPLAFQTADFFPLLPFFGFFLLGAFLGRRLYASQTTRFPRVRANAAPVRVLTWVGRWSLPIYLLHQPVITGIVMLLEGAL